MGILSVLRGRARTPALAAGPLLDFSNLRERARERSGGYAHADPFPHVVLDDFLSPAVVAQIAAEFPSRVDKEAWLDYGGNDVRGRPLQHGKLHISDEYRLGPVTQRLLYELKCAQFLDVLTMLTGIPYLIPDALNHGGGIHMSQRGALLEIHADFNRHPNWQLDRRLNLLLYLNDGWQFEWRGELELWDTGMEVCRERIAPVAGRCVIFSTSSTSYHGHPVPLACPENVTRKSIALYYYTNGEYARSTVHETLWQTRPV